jgi:hypothetical protein
MTYAPSKSRQPAQLSSQSSLFGTRSKSAAERPFDQRMFRPTWQSRWWSIRKREAFLRKIEKMGFVGST